MKTTNYYQKQPNSQLVNFTFTWLLLIICLLLSSCNGTGNTSSNSNGSVTQNSKLITEFSINNQQGVNDGNTISVVVPYGTNLTKLSPKFATTGQSVTVASEPQVSGQSTNDFSKPVMYSVKAVNGTTKNYLIKALSASADSKSITQFSVNGTAGVISGNKISVVLPYSTGSTNELIATFNTSGASVSIGDATQISGQTPNNFTTPLIYTVTAADNTQKSYVVSVIIARDTQKAITQFTVNNTAGVITENSISVVLPYDSEVNDLAPTFATSGASVSVAGVNQTSGQTVNNFTTPQTYTVTAADGSTTTYTVTITVAKNPQKTITQFSIDNISGIISANTISVVVPYGTDVSNLIATFADSGVSVNVGGTAQTSSQTPNNFTNPVTYTVTAADGTTQNYSVIVTIAKDPQNSITQYSINNVPGVFNGTSISVVLPYGTTSLSGLIANFTQNGNTITVNSVNQVSGQTPNDFTHQVVYTVTAVDGTTQNYYVNVSVAKNSQKAITQFIINNVPGVISGNYISVVLPYSTESLANLATTFATNGASVSISGTTQVSGQTENSFTQPLVYTVTAADGSATNYTVVASIALNTQKAITQFSIDNVNGIITGNSISVALPYGTPLANLVPLFATSGSSVSIAGTAQTSGQSTNNFTSPLTYTVTAADGSTQNYSVSVSLMPDTHKSFTKFSINNINGVISENNGGNNIITVTLPYGTPLSDLIATFTTTGNSVKIGSVIQTSGQTANNFATPITYTIIAADGSSKQYIVTVNIAADSHKAISQFSINNVNGTINGDQIRVQLPYNSQLSNLTPIFTTTGESVTVNGITQTSGQTANNFNAPVTYTVTAADGTTRDYVVVVYIEGAFQKALTKFAINGIAGTINGNNISVTIAGSSLNGLIATFNTTGTEVKVGSTVQVSGQTPNNFSSPLVYTVYAGDGSSQIYTVTVQENYSFSSIVGISFNQAGTNAYIYDAGLNAMITCSVNGGILSNCSGTEINSESNFFAYAQSMTFNQQGTFAYFQAQGFGVLTCSASAGVINFNSCTQNSRAVYPSILQGNIAFGTNYAVMFGSMTPTANDYLYSCQMDSSNGTFSSCTGSTPSGLPTPLELGNFVINPATNNFWVWEGNSNGLYTCQTNAGTTPPGNCTNSNASNVNNPTAYSTLTIGPTLLMINYDDPEFTQCTIDGDNLLNCTNPSAYVPNYPQFMVPSQDNTKVFMPTLSDGIYYCNFTNNTLNNCASSEAWVGGN